MVRLGLAQTLRALHWRGQGGKMVSPMGGSERFPIAPQSEARQFLMPPCHFVRTPQTPSSLLCGHRGKVPQEQSPVRIWIGTHQCQSHRQSMHDGSKGREWRRSGTKQRISHHKEQQRYTNLHRVIGPSLYLVPGVDQRLDRSSIDLGAGKKGGESGLISHCITYIVEQSKTTAWSSGLALFAAWAATASLLGGPGSFQERSLGLIRLTSIPRRICFFT